MVPCWAFDPTCFHRKYFHSVVTDEQPYFNNKYLWGIIMLNVSGLQRSPPRSPHFLHGRATQLTCLRQRIIDRKEHVASNFSREERASTHITAASSDDSAVSTTGKLLVLAFAGGALVKYGSLYSDVPFHPSPLAALLIVCSPPVGFAIWMTLQGDSTKDP